MSWYTLLDIFAINAEHARADRDPPTTCPLSGDLLETGPHGELHCVFDGWIYDGVSN